MFQSNRIHILGSALAVVGLSDIDEDGFACGELSADSTWAGADEASSDIASIESALRASGNVPANGQWVQHFAISEPINIRAEAVGVNNGDPAIVIYDAHGREIVSDDDSGGSRGARAETSIIPGHYCLVTQIYGGEQAAVNTSLGRIEHQPLTESAREEFDYCSRQELTQLNDGPISLEALKATVSMYATVAQVPAYGFELSEPSAVTITATGSSSSDPVIELRNSLGEELAENDDADGRNSRITVAHELDAGAYCLEVRDLKGDDNPIRVTLAEFDLQAHRKRGLDLAEFAPLPNDDVEIMDMGVLESSAVVDILLSQKARWISVEIPENGILSIEAVGQGVDPKIDFFDRMGRRLGKDDDGAGGTDSLLIKRVSASKYMIAVQLATSEGSGNVRLLLERFVAVN